MSAAQQGLTQAPKHAKWQLIQNVFASYGFYFAGYLLSFLLIPYLTRVLGAAEWGVFAVTQTLAMYILMIQECGFAFSATKIVAKNRENPAALSNVLAGVWGAKAILAVFCVSIAFVVLHLMPAFGRRPILFWTAVIWALLQGANLNWYYQGLERMRSAATIDISLKSIAVLVSLAIVRRPEDGWKALAATAVACLLSASILSYLVYRSVPFKWPTLGLSLKSLQNGLVVFIPRNSFLISSLAGVFILGLFASPVLVGYYAAAERISRAVIGLLLPLTDALYSRVNRILVTSPASFPKVARLLLTVMAVTGLVIGITIYALAPYLIHLFLGHSYASAVTVLRIFAIMAPLIALSNTLGVHWMLSLGLDRDYTYVTSASIIVTVIASSVGALYHREAAVAWILVSSQFVVTAGTYLALRLRHRGPWYRSLDIAAICLEPLASVERSSIGEVSSGKETLGKAQETHPPNLPAAHSNPEMLLLFTCARLHLDEVSERRLSQLTSGTLDWNYVFDQASQHGILPLAYRHLKNLPTIPSSTLAQMKFAVRSGAARNLFMTGELVKVVDLLELAGVAVIPFKGPVLAYKAYGDLSLRNFGDLDILVKPNELGKARQILVAAGYEPEFPENSQEHEFMYSTERVIKFIKKSQSVVIEVHWEFDPENLAFPSLATKDLWKHCTTQAIGGRTMQSLSPEDLLIHLCLHGAKHCWEKLEWICCLTEIMRSQTIDWTWVEKYANSLGIERVLHLSVALARELSGDCQLPAGGPGVLDPKSTELARQVLAHILSGDIASSRRMVYRYFFYWKMREHHSDRLKMLMLSSRQILRPRQLRREHRIARMTQTLGQHVK